MPYDAVDVSYIFKRRASIDHHNPNMPISCLEYIARLYEQFYKSKEKYSRKQLAIPTPEFYIFYNGKQPYTTKSVLKLSDSFTQTHDEYALELSVKVVNINYDKASEILKRCKPLEQYSLFVNAVRRNIAVDTEHGFEKAIKECIQNDILREYLQRKSKEILSMLIGEYDYDTDIAVQREESFDMGLAEGEVRGRLEGSRQAKLETAKTMLTMGYPLMDICKVSGLTQAEVESLN